MKTRKPRKKLNPGQRVIINEKRHIPGAPDHNGEMGVIEEKISLRDLSLPPVYAVRFKDKSFFVYYAADLQLHGE